MATMEAEQTGALVRISGPMVIASGMLGTSMGEIVRVGNDGLMGEVIRIDGERVYAQVFEDTQGISLGEPVTRTGRPLSVELGPGLLGATFDGIQRPLASLREQAGDFISRGLTAVALDQDKQWHFVPTAQAGQQVRGGDILGTVQETEATVHRVLVPPDAEGTIEDIVGEGDYTVAQDIATLSGGRKLQMRHYWPVKRPRPFSKKLGSNEPFLTGQRVFDTLFPIALGGSAIVPGGFGCGKTVVEQTLSKYCNADIIVYVGCGERGNEMADVLDEFPHLKDPRTGDSLMKRTILVVNTSNMPVAARDASVYTGMTLAEYYRDQGYNVAIMADSTSRWAEALREMSSRLEEMPGEEGYPTYLAARISQFYERSGRSIVCGSDADGDSPRIGSVTTVGAVSPPGGDFSEPVTQTSMRVAGALWALDSTLAYRRHYPSVNWNRSYSLYNNELKQWFTDNAPANWHEFKKDTQGILQRDGELQEVVQLVGPDALQDAERLVLEVARMVREVFLQQNAFLDADANCSLEKNAGIQEALIAFYRESQKLIEQGISLSRILELPSRESISRLRNEPSEGFMETQRTVLEQMRQDMSQLSAKKG